MTDPLSRQTTFTYDDRGRRTGVTDHLGNQTTYAYNDLDLLSTVTAPDPDGAGPLTAPVTSYSYDEFNRLSETSQPGGGIIHYAYDPAGNLLKLTDPVGNETTYSYDGLGQLAIETNESGNWRSYDYDTVGNLVRVRDRNARVLQFAYDDLDRRTSEQWRSGADPGPELTITTDTQGGETNEVQRVGYTGSFLMGGTFTLTFDGQTTAMIAYNATAAQVQSALEALSNIGSGDVAVIKTQDDLNSVQEWKLTFQGNLAGTNVAQNTIDASGVWMMGSPTDIEVTDTQGSGSQDEVQTVTLSNATGGTFRLALDGYVTAPLAYNATATQVAAALEALGSVDNVTVTGNGGGPWTVTFGGTQSGTNVSRMDGDASAASAGSVVRTLSFTYDAASQLTATSDPDSSYAIAYDNLGRVTSLDNNDTSGVPRVVLSSVYDVASNRTNLSATIAGTNDFTNDYTYDALHRLTRVDQTGQAGGNSVADKRVDLGYNALGQFTSIARYKDTDGGTANEVASAAYSYDTLGRLTGLAYTKGNSNLFTPYSWSFDSLSSAGMGFGDSVADPRIAATASSAVYSVASRVTQMVSQDGTSTYSYDAKSQLTSGAHTFQTDETYTYDNNGTSGVPRMMLSSVYDVASNRTNLSATIVDTNDFANDDTYDALHRLTRVDQIGQTGGNSVAEKRVGLGYNVLGQFTSIARYKDTDGGTTNEVASAAYSYGTLGRLTGLAYSQTAGYVWVVQRYRGLLGAYVFGTTERQVR